MDSDRSYTAAAVGYASLLMYVSGPLSNRFAKAPSKKIQGIYTSLYVCSPNPLTIKLIPSQTPTANAQSKNPKKNLTN